ncbi:MAG: hypothetical protein ACLUGJ_18700 [Blautia wexlerae]
MSKIEEGHIVLTHEYICLKDLVYEIESIITHKAADEDIQWIYEKIRRISLSLCPWKLTASSPDFSEHLWKLY